MSPLRVPCVHWVRPANVIHGRITTSETTWDCDVAGKIPSASEIQTSLLGTTVVIQGTCKVYLLADHAWKLMHRT